MPEISWPAPTYNSGAVSNVEYEQLNMFQGGGLVGLYSETAPIFADSSGRQIKIRANRYGAIHGYDWASGTGDTTVAIAANASGSTRIDRVVLRLDRSTWLVRVAVIAGTPGAGAPAYTQSFGDTGVYEISLALVTVANGAATLAPGDCVFHGMYFAPPPQIAPGAASTLLTQNTQPRAYVGQPYLDAATGTMRYHNGTGIRQLVDTATLGASLDATIYTPAVKLILPANININSGADTAVSWAGASSELLDTHNFHNTSTNTSRITPTVAGWYTLRFTPAWAANTTGQRVHFIGKNGTGQAPAMRWNFGQPTATLVLPQVETTLSANGTTDYFEAFVNQASGGVLQLLGDGNATNTFNTIFECVYLRPL